MVALGLGHKIWALGRSAVCDTPDWRNTPISCNDRINGKTRRKRRRTEWNLEALIFYFKEFSVLLLHFFR